MRMMKAKLKMCDRCGEMKVIWKNHRGNRYCQGCWKLELPKSSRSNKPTTRRKPISPRSPSRLKQELQYSKVRRLFLQNYPVCQAHLSGCTTQSTDVHHKAGRVGKLYLDESKWLAVCRACHMWIETHPNEARELGFSISRLQVEDDNN
jgi:hypothetical protein